MTKVGRPGEKRIRVGYLGLHGAVSFLPGKRKRKRKINKERERDRQIDRERERKRPSTIRK